MRSHMLRPYGLTAAMACALAAVTSSAASSQATRGPTATGLDISRGDRVRVVAAEYGDTAQIATIAAVRRDGIVFRRERQGDTLLVPFAHLGQLDVSDGRHTHGDAGLVIGLVGGVLVGAVAAQGGDNNSGFNPVGSGSLTAGGAVLGGLAGAVIGGIVGSLISTEKWRSVPLDSRVDDARASLDVMPSSKGPRLAVRVAVPF